MSNKLGRPPKQQKRVNKVTVYLDDAEFEVLERIRGDRERSEYIRSVLKQHLNQQQEKGQ